MPNQSVCPEGRQIRRALEAAYLRTKLQVIKHQNTRQKDLRILKVKNIRRANVHKLEYEQVETPLDYTTLVCLEVNNYEDEFAKNVY